MALRCSAARAASQRQRDPNGLFLPRNPLVDSTDTAASRDTAAPAEIAKNDVPIDAAALAIVTAVDTGAQTSFMPINAPAPFESEANLDTRDPEVFASPAPLVRYPSEL